MATLAEGLRYELSSTEKNATDKTVIFVKLTDSALKSIEECVPSKLNGLSKPAVQFYSTNGVLKLPNNGRYAKSYGFTLSSVEADGQQGSFECLHHRETDALESLGCMLLKMQINAKEDTYEKTRVKMAAVEEENKKMCTKEIEPSGPYVGKKVKVKRPVVSSGKSYVSLHKLDKTCHKTSVLSEMEEVPSLDKENRATNRRSFGNCTFSEEICKKRSELSRSDDHRGRNIADGSCLFDGFPAEKRNLVECDTNGQKQHNKRQRILLCKKETDGLGNEQEINNCDTEYQVVDKVCIQSHSREKHNIDRSNKQYQHNSDELSSRKPVEITEPCEVTDLSVDLNNGNNNNNNNVVQCDSRRTGRSASLHDDDGNKEQPLLSTVREDEALLFTCSKVTDEQDVFKERKDHSHLLSDAKSKEIVSVSPVHIGSAENSDASVSSDGFPINYVDRSSDMDNISVVSSVDFSCHLSPESNENYSLEGHGALHPADTMESVEYKRFYVGITSQEQREQYKRDFDTEYEHYKVLHDLVKRSVNKFAEFESELKKYEPGSREHYEIRERIYKEYVLNANDQTYQEAKKKLHFLHGKLSHIKKLVMKYDQSLAMES